MRPNPKTPLVILLLLLVGVALFLSVAVPPAGAQPASPDHGTGTDQECARYGCLYGHDRGHWTRDGYQEHTAYGIAYERLPDGPDGRYYVRVLFPAEYDPSRRGAWDQVAYCESTWRWDFVGRYHGGLQFSPTTWRAYGGTDFAPYAYQAYPAEQIAVAERVLRLGHGPYGPQGRGAWPHCGRYL